MSAKYSGNCEVGTQIQTMLFDKEHWTEAKAKEWLKENDFLYGNMDEKENTFRFRQQEPTEFEENSFRTTNFHEKLPLGVQAVIGCPKHEKMENGGYIPSEYEKSVREAAEGKAWDGWSFEQRQQFVTDKHNEIGGGLEDVLEFPQYTWNEIWDKYFRQDNDDNGDFSRFWTGLQNYLEHTKQMGFSKANHKLELISWDADIYEDDHEEGEGEHVNSIGEKVNVTFDSVDDLFKYLYNKVLYKELDKIDFNAFEDGRITTSVNVDENNYPASTAEIEKWKKGELKLYVANYNLYVALVDRVKPSVEEMATLFGIAKYEDGGQIMEAGGSVDRNKVLFDKAPLRIQTKDGIANFDFDSKGNTGWQFDTDDVAVAASIIKGSKFKDDKAVTSIPVTAKQKKEVVVKDVIFWLSGGNKEWTVGDTYNDSFENTYDGCFKHVFAKSVSAAINKAKSIGDLIKAYQTEFPVSVFIGEAEDAGYSGTDGASVNPHKSGSKQWHEYQIAKKIKRNPSFASDKYHMSIGEAEKILGEKIVSEYPSFGNEFKEISDTGNTQIYARDCGTISIGNRTIPLVATAEIVDLEGAVSEEELKGMRYSVSIKLFANPAFIDKANYDSVRSSMGGDESDYPDDEIFGDFIEQMSGVNVTGKDFKKKMDAQNYVLGKEMGKELDGVALMSGFTLDKPFNRMGKTGWDVIKNQIDAEYQLFAKGGEVEEGFHKFGEGVKVKTTVYMSAEDVGEEIKEGTEGVVFASPDDSEQLVGVVINNAHHYLPQDVLEVVDFTNLLLKYGFKKTNVPYEFKNGNRYTAILWRDNSQVSLSHYTPNTHRLLDTLEYTTIEDLKKRLINAGFAEVFEKGGGVGGRNEIIISSLTKLVEYSEKLPPLVKKVHDLPACILSKMAKVEQSVANVKHTLEPKNPELFEKGGAVGDDSDGDFVSMQCKHIGTYAKALLAAAKNGFVFDSWMQYQLNVAGDYIDSVYHTLDYKINGSRFELGGDIEVYANGGSIKLYRTEGDGIKFNSHTNHNPNCDILEGKIDSDSFMTYGIYVLGDKKGQEFMEYYRGENYVVGSTKRSHSNYFAVNNIPSKYKDAWEELKKIYETRYANGDGTTSDKGGNSLPKSDVKEEVIKNPDGSVRNVIKYKKVGGTYYHEETPDAVCRALETALNTRSKIKIYYGDIETGRDWKESNDTIGTVGRSTGDIKIPLLIATSRSMGGGAILDHCILKIKDVRTGHVIYQQDNYKAPKVEIVPSDMDGYSNNVNIDGELFSRHKTLRSAQMMEKKMMASGGAVIDDTVEDHSVMQKDVKIINEEDENLKFGEIGKVVTMIVPTKEQRLKGYRQINYIVEFPDTERWTYLRSEMELAMEHGGSLNSVGSDMMSEMNSGADFETQNVEPVEASYRETVGDEMMSEMADGGSVNALDKLWNFPEYGVSTYRKLLDKGIFSGKYKSIENAVQFDRLKDHRMNNQEQKAYYERVNKKKVVYCLQYADDPEKRNYIEVSKAIYDYANVPELPEKNLWLEYENGGDILANGGSVSAIDKEIAAIEKTIANKDAWKEFKELQAQNDHCTALVLIAYTVGNDEDKKAAVDFLSKQKREGHLSGDANAQSVALQHKLWKLFKWHCQQNEGAKMADGGDVAQRFTKEEFTEWYKNAMRENGKWHMFNAYVDGVPVQMKMFVDKKSVDVQIFKVNYLHVSMPRNYEGKKATSAMIQNVVDNQMGRINQMVQNWKKESRAFSHINNNDGEFFEKIGVPVFNIGTTSSTGSDILYYDTDVYASGSDALKGIKVGDKMESGGEVEKPNLATEYLKEFTLRGNGKRKYTIFQSGIDYKQAVKKLFPKFTDKQHKDRAGIFAEMYSEAQAKWNKLVNTEFEKLFHRPYEVKDYKVSGIVRDEFSEGVKNILRDYVKKMSDYLAAMRIHNAALKVKDKVEIPLPFEKGGDISVGKVADSIKDIKKIECYYNFSVRGNANQIECDKVPSQMIDDYCNYLSNKEFLEKYSEVVPSSFDDDDFEPNGNVDEFRVTQEYYIVFNDDSGIFVDFGLPEFNFMSADVTGDAVKDSLAEKWLPEYDNKEGWDMDIDSLVAAVKNGSKYEHGGSLDEFKVYDISTWKYLMFVPDKKVGIIKKIEYVKTGSALTKKDFAKIEEEAAKKAKKHSYPEPESHADKANWWEYMDFRFIVTTANGDESWHISKVLPLTFSRFQKNGGNKIGVEKYENGGEIDKMTPREVLEKFVFGANVFRKEVTDRYEIEGKSIRNDAEAKAYYEDLKKRGFTVKKKSYSDFTAIKGVKRKPAVAEIDPTPHLRDDIKIEGVEHHYVDGGFDWNTADQKFGLGETDHPQGEVYVKGDNGYVAIGHGWYSFNLDDWRNHKSKMEKGGEVTRSKYSKDFPPMLGDKIIRGTTKGEVYEVGGIEGHQWVKLKDQFGNKSKMEYNVSMITGAKITRAGVTKASPHYADDRLTEAGWDITKLTNKQKDLILEPVDAPENYMQDNEISEDEAKRLWLKKLKDSGLNKQDIEKAKVIIMAKGGKVNARWISKALKVTNHKGAKHAGALRRKAKSLGWIKGEEPLTIPILERMENAARKENWRQLGAWENKITLAKTLINISHK